jgi:hypothetical protein
VFADAAGEDHRIQPAGRCRERAEFAHDAVAEELDRFLGFGLVAGDQRAHVLRDAGDAEQSGFLVEQMRHFLHAEALAVHDVQDQARIDRAAARAHDEAVERREAERRGDALAIDHRRHAGAIAQMADDDAAVGLLAVLRQHAGDVLVRNAVEAVALRAFFGVLARQAVHLRDFRLRAVESGVEARDLRHAGEYFLDGVDAVQVVRLVQRREALVVGELVEVGGAENDRMRVAVAAMHDAVADGDDLAALGAA